MNARAARRLKLLVLDDDPSMVRMLTEVIDRRQGQLFLTTGLTDPVAAKEWLNQNICDVLISDISMPELDGMEILRFIKARNPWTQVVFVTAFTSFDRLTTAVECGASDYLIKPIDFELLAKVLVDLHARCTRWQEAMRGTFSALTPA